MKSNRKCPSCNNKIISNKRLEELYCSKCGLVIDNNFFFDGVGLLPSQKVYNKVKLTKRGRLEKGRMVIREIFPKNGDVLIEITHHMQRRYGKEAHQNIRKIIENLEYKIIKESFKRLLLFRNNGWISGSRRIRDVALLVSYIVLWEKYQEVSKKRSASSGDEDIIKFYFIFMAHANLKGKFPTEYKMLKRDLDLDYYYRHQPRSNADAERVSLPKHVTEGFKKIEEIENKFPDLFFKPEGCELDVNKVVLLYSTACNLYLRYKASLLPQKVDRRYLFEACFYSASCRECYDDLVWLKNNFGLDYTMREIVLPREAVVWRKVLGIGSSETFNNRLKDIGEFEPELLEKRKWLETFIKSIKS